jgi:tetratricopeptide (TPR) repeat protein
VNAETFDRLGNVRGEGTAALQVGIVLTELKRPEEAWRSLGKALGLLRKAGYSRFVGLTLDAMRNLRLEARRYDEAAALFQQAAARSESSGDRQWAAIERTNIARVLAERGRPGEALEPLTASCTQQHALGYRANEAICLTHAPGAPALRDQDGRAEGCAGGLRARLAARHPLCGERTAPGQPSRPERVATVERN